MFMSEGAAAGHRQESPLVDLGDRQNAVIELAAAVGADHTDYANEFCIWVNIRLEFQSVYYNKTFKI